MTPQAMIPHHHPFVKAVGAALRHHCGVRPTPAQRVRLVVATSGGADSVALVRALAALAKRRTWRLELAVGHVQHHLRDEAEQDARFVAGLAQRLDLPFLRADLDLSADGGNLEARARHARYEALAAMAGDFKAAYVATAHHSDDQLETLLMRLLRGSGVRGLRCMAWRRRLRPDHDCLLVRPMLAVNRATAYNYLAALDQPWQHDHTNADVTRLRARLRRQVIPLLAEIRPDVSAKAVTLADQMRQVHHWIHAETSRHTSLVNRDGDESTVTRAEARQLPDIVLTTLLRELITQAGCSADRIGQRTLTRVARAVSDRQGGRRVFQLRAGHRVIVTSDRVTITRD